MKERTTPDSDMAAIKEALLTGNSTGMPSDTELAALNAIEALEAEVADLKVWVIAGLGPHAVQYAKEHGFAPGELYPNHYDVLARCGARMVEFKRGADR